MSGFDKTMDALIADALQWKAIPEENDELVIGLVEAVRRLDQRLRRRKGGQITSQLTGGRAGVRRAMIQYTLAQLPPANRDHPFAEASLDLLEQKLGEFWPYPASRETLRSDLCKISKETQKSDKTKGKVL